MDKYFFAQKGFVMNNRRDVLFIKYANSQFLPSKLNGKYALPGGKIEMGETPDESIIKEVQEETGIICKPEEPFYIFNWEYDKGGDHVQINAVIRACQYVSGEPLVVTKQEKELDIVEVAWVPWDKITDLDIVHDEATGIRLYLNKL